MDIPDIDLIQAVALLGLAGLSWIGRTEWMKVRESFGTKLIFAIARAACGFIYKNKVRQAKAASPNGKLSETDRRQSAWQAVGLIQAKAKAAGLSNHPLIADERLTHGVVEAVVAEAKAKRTARDLTRPGTTH